ncbi:omega-hydroxypalmitate O-feruloyl transferase-like [Durio zibethinus]|uniref:Omega-hydroxypalmitate O-feruloyl transferase-like n=1 Tax=Durio zibethinus TaxID=66656 RepID=A0A6P6AC42_DURZI|nr:omega-hydroxypalmitate O-feruloyl transferase-like [Durio zibethinus]
MEACNGTAKAFAVKKQEAVQVVRPAEKTYNGLYFLSNLDHTFPYPIEIVFAYKNGMENAVETIKESLAKILVEFYPFAGCLSVTWDGKMIVRSNGEGVPFVKAVSNNTIEELGDISRVDPVKLRQLVHHVDSVESILDVPLLTVQITSFKCGGIVLGVAMNHVLVDGKALADFLNSWSQITKGLPLSVVPFLDRTILSARQPPLIDIPHPEYVRKERPTKNASLQFPEPLVYQSFCVEPKKLYQLKQLAKEGEFAAPPSSFEVISALMWIMRTKAFKIEPHKTTKLLIAVDGRPKYKPPLPECFFGNGIAFSCAQCTARDLVQKPFSFAVKIVHESIKEVTEGYIRSAIDYYELTRGGLEIENTCWISKWSRLTFYDVDFGWGKPQQVAPASIVENLVLTLAQGKDSKNLILSLALPESAMKIFQELMQSELNENKSKTMTHIIYLT